MQEQKLFPCNSKNLEICSKISFVLQSVPLHIDRDVISASWACTIMTDVLHADFAERQRFPVRVEDSRCRAFAFHEELCANGSVRAGNHRFVLRRHDIASKVNDNQPLNISNGGKEIPDVRSFHHYFLLSTLSSNSCSIIGGISRFEDSMI
jgi:hypothetical protein